MGVLERSFLLEPSSVECLFLSPDKVGDCLLPGSGDAGAFLLNGVTDRGLLSPEMEGYLLLTPGPVSTEGGRLSNGVTERLCPLSLPRGEKFSGAVSSVGDGLLIGVTDRLLSSTT